MYILLTYFFFTWREKNKVGIAIPIRIVDLPFIWTNFYPLNSLAAYSEGKENINQLLPTQKHM